MTETRVSTITLVLLVLASANIVQAGRPTSSGQAGNRPGINDFWKRHQARNANEQPASDVTASAASSDRCPTAATSSEADSVLMISAIGPIDGTYIAQPAVFESLTMIPTIEELGGPFSSFVSEPISYQEVVANSIPLPPFGEETDLTQQPGRLAATISGSVSTGSFSVFDSLPLAEIPALPVDANFSGTEAFIEAVPTNWESGSTQMLFAQNIEPTPVIPSVPPAPISDNMPTEHPSRSADPLFVKRFAELNKPMTGIGLAIPGTTGPLLKNYAAELAKTSHPEVLSGANGWWEPRNNLYPVPFYYQPLYFEEKNLERCGQGHGFAQPLFSSAAFVKNTIFLPYHLVVTPPRSLVLSPGNCPTDSRFPIFHD